MNKGKLFEKDIKNSAQAQKIWILRLNDTSLSWVKEKTARFTPHNVCDFLAYEYPYLFAWECKSTTYKSITIQREVKGQGMIKMLQIQDLTNLSLVNGIFSGLILNFRNDEDISDNITYYLPIDKFNEFLAAEDKSSINQKDCEHYGGIVVPQSKKRVHYFYDLDLLMKLITGGNKNGDSAV